ncbi:XRE family transcriptional regulator [Amylibacter marinus]|uniref:XRE family transcriptional regulator n=1 Tax=Amylibacter marinus TaxID=1475483 RepID=A0ABQ5VWM8_9RHOB|nr:short-chain fatty acyl-CoA regulator family protein [Amylibacter marinus]GLQ35597.1 XRE family transcriptional regulator [Amylibacter marinus]
MARTLLGTRIREARRAKRLTQKDLARIAGISASYLNLIEHNRRGIAGKTLLSLANALEIDQSLLSEGSDRALVDRVKKAALSASHLKPETERTEEFTARYPGFARLVARLQDQQEQQQENFAALADQMHNDPFFAESIHLMLSNITAIHSTADILASMPDIPRDQSQRFLQNLLSESARLSETASDVLDHFEPSSDAQVASPDNAPFDTLLEQHHFYLEPLEQGRESVAEMVEKLAVPAALQIQTKASLQSYVDMATTLPIQPFLETAQAHHFDALSIASDMGVALPLVMFRLAHMPQAPDMPRFGLLQCDGSGAVLYRKQLPVFALPRFGGACPLWPIYRSASQPTQPIAAFIDLPSGERLFTLSYSYPTEVAQIGMPAQSESIMLFTADYALIDGLKSLPQLSVGMQCAVCPRQKCSARRSAYLLDK